jgi:hypothetical protein
MSDEAPLAPNIELQKLEIERRKLDLERRKVEIELSKTKWTAVSVMVPLLAGIGTVGFGLWSTREQAKSAFEVEVAKSILSAPTPSEAAGKADFFMKLFPGKLPATFAGQVDYVSFDAGEVAAKKLLFEMMAKKLDPGDSLSLWRSLFPDDEWARTLNFSEVSKRQSPQSTKPAE